MDGMYGDSTRSVKAVGLESSSGTARGADAGTGVDIPPLARRDRAAGQLRAQLQPVVAPAGIGARRTGGRGAALTFGSGMAAITSALRVLAKPGTTLVVPADGYYQVRRYAAEYLAPQGITVIEAECRRHV